MWARKLTTKVSISPKRERRTTRAPKCGRTSSTTSSLTFGHSDVSYTNWSLSVHLFRQKICKACSRKSSKEFIQGFPKLFRKIWITWSKCCCKWMLIRDLGAMSCSQCRWFCLELRSCARKFTSNKWKSRKSPPRRSIICWKLFMCQNITIPKIKTRKRQSTRPNLTNLSDISNNRCPNPITTSKSQPQWTVKKLASKTPTAPNAEVNSKNKILKRTSQRAKQAHWIQAEKGETAFTLTTRIPIAKITAISRFRRKTLLRGYDWIHLILIQMSGWKTRWTSNTWRPRPRWGRGRTAKRRDRTWSWIHECR